MWAALPFGLGHGPGIFVFLGSLCCSLRWCLFGLACCVGSWWLAYGGSSKVCPNPRWLTVGLFAFGGPLWSGCLGSMWRRGVSPFESPLWPLGFRSVFFFGFHVCADTSARTYQTKTGARQAHFDFFCPNLWHKHRCSPVSFQWARLTSCPAPPSCHKLLFCLIGNL